MHLRFFSPLPFLLSSKRSLSTFFQAPFCLVRTLSFAMFFFLCILSRLERWIWQWKFFFHAIFYVDVKEYYISTFVKVLGWTTISRTVLKGLENSVVTALETILRRKVQGKSTYFVRESRNFFIYFEKYNLYCKFTFQLWSILGTLNIKLLFTHIQLSTTVSRNLLQNKKKKSRKTRKANQS